MATGLKSRVLTFIFLLLMLTPMAPMMQGASPSAHLPNAPAAPALKNETTPPHGARTVTRQEIYQAIQDDLVRRGAPGGQELRPEDLSIQSSVPALRDDLGLQVKGLRFDPLRRVTAFKLWTSSQPQYLPFEVTTTRDLQSLGLTNKLAQKFAEGAGGNRTESPTTAQVRSGTGSKPPVLAKPGTPARLMMLGENLRITLNVIPLQPGIKGQNILVRDLDTGRVMTVEVVDQNLLQTHF
jgi:hypothetical protein